MSAVQDGDEASALASMRAMMELLNQLPTFLPAAERWAKFQLELAMHRRVAHEDHPCLRCGVPAAEAFLSQHRDDRTWRWLDLCHGCGYLMRKIAESE